MFKKILFATTGTPSCDAAARVAFDMARRYGADLLAIHVFGIPARSYSQTVTDIRTGREVGFNEDDLRQIREDLTKTYAKQMEAYKACDFEVMVGIPHTEILRLARKQDVDLIIMGARTDPEESPDNRHLVGRTLQGVARTARCPVLVIGRAAASFWGGITRIVLGTDFSKASDSAFMFALQLARKLECSLHIFHAIDITPGPFEITRDQNEIEDRIREAREIIRKKYVSRLGDFKNYEIDVWEGTPYVEIVKFAREKYADLIVMAHHTRRVDPDKAVLGSTVEQVALRSNSPVISVNHPDKVSEY